MKMMAAAVASSSGDFSENGHPIVSPVTGDPIEDPRGVSVFAPSCMAADALTKVGFLQPGNDALFRNHGAVAIVIDGAGSRHRLGGD